MITSVNCPSPQSTSSTVSISSEEVCSKPSERTYLNNLKQRLLSTEEIRLDALRACTNENQQSFLLKVVKLSKESDEYVKASANAAMILTKAGFSFSNEDLQGIRIPQADLSGGVFSSKLTLWRLNFEENQIQDEKLASWPIDSLHEKKFLFSNDFSFVLLAGKKNYLLNIKNTTLKLLKLNKHDYLDCSASFDASNSLCSVCFNIENRLDISGKVLLWDTQTGELMHQIKIPFLVSSMKFSTDGSLLACIGKNGVRVWQVIGNQLKLLWRLPILLETKNIQLNESDWEPSSRLFLQPQDEEQQSIEKRWKNDIDDVTRTLAQFSI